MGNATPWRRRSGNRQRKSYASNFDDFLREPKCCVLSLSNYRISDEDVEKLVQPKLRELSMNSTRCESDVARHFESVFYRDSSIQKLTLSNHHATPNSPYQSLTQTVAFSKCLRTFTLYYVDMDDKPLASLARGLRKNSTLETCYEESVPEQPKPSHSILLRNCSTLKNLHIDGVEFGTRPVFSRCQSLADKDNNLDVRLATIRLDLRGRGAPNTSLKMLFAALERQR